MKKLLFFLLICMAEISLVQASVENITFDSPISKQGYGASIQQKLAGVYNLNTGQVTVAVIVPSLVYSFSLSTGVTGYVTVSVGATVSTGTAIESGTGNTHVFIIEDDLEGF